MKLSDVEISINESRFPLRLTLGALAEIEEKLGVETILHLIGRVAHPRTEDVLTILEPLLKAGGNVFSREMLADAEVNIAEILRAISKTFTAAMAMEAPEKPSAVTRDG